MGKAFWVSKIFGVSQFFVLIALGLVFFLAYKRKQMFRHDAYSDPNLRSGNWNSGRGLSGGQTTGKDSAAKDVNQDNASTPPQLTSAFPNWDVKTPAHEILGVSAQASASEIESAYKKLLKKYHPDRFAHWGGAYQTRAHYVVTVLQKAREDLLKKK